MTEQVTLDPPDKVVFNTPFKEAQMDQLQIKNNGKRSIIFKMKTTRPFRFKMRPVFGLIEPGAVAKVQLICKPILMAHRRPNTRDRFTVVTAPAPPGCSSASGAWQSYDTDEVKNHAQRHVLAIVYQSEDAVAPVASKQSTPAPSVVVEPSPQPPTASTSAKASVSAPTKEQDSDDDSGSSDCSDSDCSGSDSSGSSGSSSSSDETDEAHS